MKLEIIDQDRQDCLQLQDNNQVTKMLVLNFPFPNVKGPGPAVFVRSGKDRTQQELQR